MSHCVLFCFIFPAFALIGHSPSAFPAYLLTLSKCLRKVIIKVSTLLLSICSLPILYSNTLYHMESHFPASEPAWAAWRNRETQSNKHDRKLGEWIQEPRKHFCGLCLHQNILPLFAHTPTLITFPHCWYHIKKDEARSDIGGERGR